MRYKNPSTQYRFSKIYFVAAICPYTFLFLSYSSLHFCLSVYFTIPMTLSAQIIPLFFPPSSSSTSRNVGSSDSPPLTFLFLPYPEGQSPTFPPGNNAYVRTYVKNGPGPTPPHVKGCRPTRRGSANRDPQDREGGKEDAPCLCVCAALFARVSPPLPRLQPYVYLSLAVGRCHHGASDFLSYSLTGATVTQQRTKVRSGISPTFYTEEFFSSVFFVRPLCPRF